jgi:hypothetical protein
MRARCRLRTAPGSQWFPLSRAGRDGRGPSGDRPALTNAVLLLDFDGLGSTARGWIGRRQHRRAHGSACRPITVEPTRRPVRLGIQGRRTCRRSGRAVRSGRRTVATERHCGGSWPPNRDSGGLTLSRPDPRSLSLGDKQMPCHPKPSTLASPRGRDRGEKIQDPVALLFDLGCRGSLFLAIRRGQRRARRNVRPAP